MRLLADVLREVAQVLLGVLGLLMLVGGGACVAIDSVALVTSQGVWMAMMLVVAIAVALSGWGLIKLAGAMNSTESGEAVTSETAKRADRHE